MTECEHPPQFVATFPWYRMCLLCYLVFDPANLVDLQEGPTEAEYLDTVANNSSRPWHRITPRDPIFMAIMRELICPRCGGIVVEENLKRRDGTICTGFTCVKCPNRWWVEES